MFALWKHPEDQDSSRNSGSGSHIQSKHARSYSQEDEPPIKKRKHNKTIECPSSDIYTTMKEIQNYNVFAIASTPAIGFRLLVTFLARSVEGSRRNTTVLSTTSVKVARDLARDVFDAGACSSLGKPPPCVSPDEPENYIPDIYQHDIAVLPIDYLLTTIREGTLKLGDVHSLAVVLSRSSSVESSIAPLGRLYNSSDPSLRPRILAIVDESCSHRQAGQYLDLCQEHFQTKSFVVGATTSQEGPRDACGPTETTVSFQCHPNSGADDALSAQIRAADSNREIAPRLYCRAQEIFNELGEYAVGKFWKRILSGPLSGGPWSTEDSRNPELLNIVKMWGSRHATLNPRSGKWIVSYKFMEVVELLKEHKSSSNDFKGLIVVQEQVIAESLCDLLTCLDGRDKLDFVRPLFLDEVVKAQTIQKFADGSYNLLVIPREYEDLEIPTCSLVVRFDVIDSHLSYVYSRLRCRGPDTSLIHLLEQYNDEHQEIISGIRNLDSDLQQWANNIIQGGEFPIPPKSLRETPVSDDLDREECIRDPTTGSFLTVSDAQYIVHRIAANLQSDQCEYWIRPLFSFSGEAPSITCTVLLPAASPIHSVVGPPCTTTIEARRQACFKACKELLAMDVLDHRIFPRRSSNADDDHGTADVATGGTSSANSSAVASTGTHRYPKKNPQFWLNSRNGKRKRFYPTILDAGHFKDAYHAPILALTREPLPRLEEFSVFSAYASGKVHLRRGAPMEFNDEQLTALHGYTVRICRALTNKPFARSADEMPYFLAPLNQGALSECVLAKVYSLQADVHIPWDLVKLAVDSFAVPLLSEGRTIGDINALDCIVQDRRVEFTNRFFVTTVKQNMTPLSKPEDNSREAGYASFLEYCKARVKDFQGLRDENQPLVEIAPVPPALNYLNPTLKPLAPSEKAMARYLVPELCMMFAVPASTFRTMLLVPCVMQRIDDQLLAQELNARFFRHSIHLHHLLAALTPPAATVEYDYERLELLGDAFLKYVASVYVFVAMPYDREGALHTARQTIISNKALLAGATQSGLPPYIQSKPFVAKSWEPIAVETSQSSTDSVASGSKIARQHDAKQTEPGKAGGKRSKKQKQRDEQDIQWLGDKTVADVVEAIIGATYLSSGSHVALKMMKTLRVKIPLVKQWSDFARMVHILPATVTNLLPADTVRAVEVSLGCRFDKPQFLAQALTHNSFDTGGGYTGYDRLEFIGDAILDFLVVDYIFHRYRSLAPAGLTLLKSAMVSNHTLAALCVSIGLHKHFRYNAPEVGNAMRRYVGRLEAMRQKEYTLAGMEGRLPGQYWLGVDPPKTLSDVVESILGALYISDDFTDMGVTRVFDHVLRPFFDHHVRLHTLCPHPVTTLYEVLQSYGCNQHRMVRDKGQNGMQCEVIVHDVTLVAAEEATAAAAMRSAALCALDAVDGDPEFMIRTCDCRATQQSKKKDKVQKARLGYVEDGDA